MEKEVLEKLFWSDTLYLINWLDAKMLELHTPDAKIKIRKLKTD